MKPVKINISRLTYTLDIPVLVLFVAVLLDIISTTLFVGLGAGVEKNLILSRLVEVSIWFIPVYLLATDAIFIPFLSGVLRKTFCITFASISIFLAVNNFSLIIFDSAFLMDTIGFNAFVILFILLGCALFAYLLVKEGLNRRETLLTCLKFILFIMFIASIHLFFWMITRAIS